jgi:hypothetical protein
MRPRRVANPRYPAVRADKPSSIACSYPAQTLPEMEVLDVAATRRSVWKRNDHCLKRLRAQGMLAWARVNWSDKHVWVSGLRQRSGDRLKPMTAGRQFAKYFAVAGPPTLGRFARITAPLSRMTQRINLGSGTRSALRASGEPTQWSARSGLHCDQAYRHAMRSFPENLREFRS